MVQPQGLAGADRTRTLPGKLHPNSNREKNMGGFIDTFKRKECKYRIGADQRREIADAILAHMVNDEHGPCRVDSLYFDTEDSSIICRSMEKPVFKEKLRIRAYRPLGYCDTLSEPLSDEPVFVELKKKYKGIVYKRRVQMSYAAAMEFLSGAPYGRSVCENPMLDAAAQEEALSAHNCQIAHEIEAFASHGSSGLQPAMLISCEREAFVEAPWERQTDDLPRELRVTFDSCIEYAICRGFATRNVAEDADTGMHLDASLVSRDTGDIGMLLDPGESIMEIKAIGAYPLWLAHALRQSEIYPMSFSKYGESFMASRNGEACGSAFERRLSRPQGSHLSPAPHAPAVESSPRPAHASRNVAAISSSPRTRSSMRI